MFIPRKIQRAINLVAPNAFQFHHVYVCTQLDVYPQLFNSCYRQFLPPTNEVWGKVIFSQACVKKSFHRGCLVWGVPGRGGAWSEVGVCSWGLPGPRVVCSQLGVCSGGCLVPGGTWWRPPGTATAVAVPILLECIHVNQCVYAHSFRRRGIKTKLISPYGFIFKLVHYKSARHFTETSN